jgi:hypothetical protein
MNTVITDILKDYSDQGLINLASELQQDTIAPESDIRTIAINAFGNDSVIDMLMLAVPLASVLADRLSVSSPHVQFNNTKL